MLLDIAAATPNHRRHGTHGMRYNCRQRMRSQHWIHWGCCATVSWAEVMRLHRVVHRVQGPDL